MEIESEKEGGNVVIDKKIELGEGNSYLFISIVCFLIVILVLVALGVVFLVRPSLLMSPQNTISYFLEGFNNSYDVFVGENASKYEVEIVEGFLNNINYSEEIKRGVADEFGLVLGLGKSFEDAPYLDKLDDDSIVIYDSDNEVLYVYASSLKALGEITDILAKDESKLIYPSIKVFRTQIQALVIKK